MNPFFEKLNAIRVNKYIDRQDDESVKEKVKIFWKDMQTVDTKTPFVWQCMLSYIDKNPGWAEGLESAVLKYIGIDTNDHDNIYDYWIRLDLLEESGLTHKYISSSNEETLSTTDLGKRFLAYIDNVSSEQLKADASQVIFSEELTFFDL